MSANLQCPRCHSDALYSYGRIKNGKQRYLCLMCNRQFVPDPLRQKVKKRPICPACGGRMHVYMRQDNVIRFRCADYPKCRGYAAKPSEVAEEIF